MSLHVAIGPSSFAAQDKTPLNMLEAAGCEVVPNPFGRRLTEEEIIEHLKEVDGLIAGLEPLNAKVIASAPRLKAIARVGIGVANVDFDAAAQHDVKVSSTPEEPINAVAEMTVASLLCLCRRIVTSNAALHNKEWKKSIGMGLGGAKILIIGYGRIGRRTAELLRVFGARIRVYDPYIKPDSLTEDEQYVVNLQDALGQADVISLHASGTDCILDAPAFANMKDGVFLLNSARGKLVDEAAVVDALKTGKVAGAWFDVFWQEPYVGPLTEFEQVLLSPHVGTYTVQCRLSMESAAVNNLLRDLGVSQ